jgi:hypothetical protein
MKRIMRKTTLRTTIATVLATAAAANFSIAAATPVLLATGSLSGVSDLSGLSGAGNVLESGLSGDVFGGLGSGLAWAGGSTFLALPDRGPNATSYAGGAAVDNTTSYVGRFQTINMSLTASSSGTLPFTLTPTLTNTTLLYSPTALTYGATAGLANAVPTINTQDKFFFTGRSDGFDASGNSLNPNNARLDPESLRVSKDGKSVFISDEYGPYVYQFDRYTGERLRSYALPANEAVTNLSSLGATEISGNTSGRVANKGMEGLAITPDGKTLVGLVQSPLIQDGGDGGRMNRIVTIDIATGATHEYAYDNYLVDKNKAYNSSEILAINDHEFMILERDGKGLGDGSNAVVKRIYKVDLTGAVDVSALSGEAALLANAPSKTLVLDLKTILNANGISDANISAKLEGLSFGEDVVVNGQTLHTLYLANDNDFVPAVAGTNKFFVFGFTDADLPGYVSQSLDTAPVPLPAALPLLGSALAGFAALRRRRRDAGLTNVNQQ